MEETSKSNNFLQSDKGFAIITSALSFAISLLYIWKGYKEVFFIGTWVIIGLNLLYIPFVFIFKRKNFPIFYLVYAISLLFVLAFYKTCLYNNFTGLFIIMAVIMIRPKLKLPAYIAYFIAVSVAFALNDELIYHYFIHLARATWFTFVFKFVLESKYDRKKLILYDDERRILEQLSNGKHYQKEVEGFSENTIYRKLKAARERNGCKTREELLELFRNETVITEK